MPHGVLFRGSEEGKFREELIAKRNILEAVIGLPSGLFYGTGIPAALLIINKAKKDDKILFINADGEYKEGKNQNLLRAEDIEKINFTYQNKLELTKYSRLVTLEEIQKEDFNLNIRRYVDNTPPPTPHDVKAHLKGGIPKAEWNDELMNSYSIQSDMLFVSKDENYFEFKSELIEKQNIRELLENSEAFQITDEKILSKVKGWYKEYQTIIDEPNSNIATLYTSGYFSIEKAFENDTVLDKFKVRGIFASWWVENKFTIKSLKNSGYDYNLLNDSFVASNESFLSALNKEQLTTHIKLLELFKKLKSAKEENDKIVVREKISELKAELFKDVSNIKELVILQLKLDSQTIANRYLSEKKQTIIKTLENLWDKYKVSLAQIESERNEATNEIKSYLSELGYL
jgi:type I restriction enzyme M protein